MCDLRVGHGYDVHRLVANRDLILGGVRVPHSTGLLGHSDADVLIHAVMDSIVGALAIGDIGKLFPDSDEKYRDISSMELLSQVKKILDDSSASVVNIDATVVAQKPKLAPYIAEMKSNIATVLQIPQNRVNIKATTEEGLGFTGNEEGIASHAVCLLMINN